MIDLFHDPVLDLVLILRLLEQRARGHIAMNEVMLNIVEYGHEDAEQVGSSLHGRRPLPLKADDFAFVPGRWFRVALRLFSRELPKPARAEAEDRIVSQRAHRPKRIGSRPMKQDR